MNKTTMFVLGALCVLSMLAATSNSLTCIECMSTNATSCTGDAVTCTAGYVCATSYTESTVDGLNLTRYVQSCAPQNLCNKVGSITTLNGTTKMSTSCCSSDNCTAPILAVPPVSPEPNGVTCPACQSSSSGFCYNTQTVDCSGEETVCALYSTNIGGNLTSIRGCARQSTCGSQKYNVNGTAIIYQPTCYCGGNPSNTYCPDTKVTCPKGTICARVRANNTGGNASIYINKSVCLPIYQCGMSGSASFPNSNLTLVTICSTDNCNLPEPTVTSPDASSAYNGVTCPACASKNSEWCKAESTMKCRGSESICLLHTAELPGNSSIFRGCATRSACYLGRLSDSNNGLEFDFKLMCSIGGYNLSCTECMKTNNSMYCTGNNVTCSPGYVCASSYSESTVGGSNSTRYIRSCAPQIQCDKNGSVSSPYGNIKTSTSCCAFDNCSSSILPVPPVSREPNGVTCPTCQSSSSGFCYDTQTVDCSGEETVCALYSTNIGGDLRSIRGCARQSICSSQKYNVNGTAISYQSSCYCGGNPSNTYCADTKVTCPKGTICARVRANNTGGNASIYINKSVCLPIYQCGMPSSASFSYGNLSLVTICSTDNCNLPEPTVTSPDDSTPYNNVTCPVCASQNSEWCKAEDRMMQCRGSESICLLHTAKLPGNSSVFRGCATRSACYLGRLSDSNNGLEFDFKFICSFGGYNLSCTECMETNSCTGNNVTCSPGYVCASSYSESTLGGSNSTRYIRSCAPQSQCDKAGSVSTPYGSIKTSTSCCAFDNCSSSILPVPSTSPQPNGVTCSTCQEPLSSWCYNQQTMQCTGEENVCVLYSTNIAGKVSAVRGCARPSICSSQKYSVNGMRVVYQPNCYCGGNPNNTYCRETNTTCPDGTICAKVYALTTVGNTSFGTYNSTCLPINQCGLPGSVSTLNGTVQLVTICSTNDCSLPDPALTKPDPNSTYNGVTCRSCESENSEWCSSHETMQCIGNETVCVVHTAMLSGTPMVFRGCATKTGCILSNLSHSGNGSQFDFKFICLNGENRGYSLSCQECLSSTSCAEKNVTCSPGNVCGTLYHQTNMDGSIYTRYIRSCVPSNRCDSLPSSITMANGNMTMSTSCCAFDNCSSAIQPVQPSIAELNGMTCPSCQSSYSKWCHNPQTVQCRGEDTVCVLHSTTIDGKSSAIRGCAQPSACNRQTYSVNGKSIVFQSICTCGGNASNTYCPETNVTCPKGTICTTVHALTTMGDASFERRTRTCLPIYQCGVAGSTTFLKGTMKLVTLCSTNNCKLNEPQFSEEDLNPNGVTCQNCMAADADCHTTERMQCTGNEEWCFYQASDLSGETSAKTAIRGCGTKNICDLGTESYNSLGIQADVKYFCSSGSKHFLTSFFFLIVLCTLFLKY